MKLFLVLIRDKDDFFLMADRRGHVAVNESEYDLGMALGATSPDRMMSALFQTSNMRLISHDFVAEKFDGEEIVVEMNNWLMTVCQMTEDNHFQLGGASRFYGSFRGILVKGEWAVDQWKNGREIMPVVDPRVK